MQILYIAKIKPISLESEYFFLHQMCWGFFPPHWSIFWYQLGVLKFNSDTIYLESASDATNWGLSPTGPSLLQMPVQSPSLPYF